LTSFAQRMADGWSGRGGGALVALRFRPGALWGERSCLWH